MLFILMILLVGHHVSSEDTTNDCSQINYRLTRLEVATTDKLSSLQKDIKDVLTDQKSSIKATENITLQHIKHNVPDNTKVATFEIEDLVKTINERLKNLESLLSEHQKILKNISYSRGHETTYPKNCAEVFKKTSNGIYTIKPGKFEIPAFCDFTTNWGGWTVIQSRKSGDIEFYNGWNDYKKGFGNLQGDFWLGLENIYQLTNAELNELLIELEDFDGAKRWAKYSSFGIGSEEEGYSLKILGTYSGDAGDSLSYHAGQKFSTKDRDWASKKCAVTHLGAWWYNRCHQSNLNGKYLKGNLSGSSRAKGMCWTGFRGLNYSLKTSRMLIRPVRYNK